MVNRKISKQDDRTKPQKMPEKLSKKNRTRIGGYAILKTIHSLHFMIVNLEWTLVDWRFWQGRPTF
jgi:hypothetical protein